MISVKFKDVGQGDSIWLKWDNNKEHHFGIVDCHLSEGKNPILNEVIEHDVKFVDFIILSHLHFDHYSGFASLIRYCIENKILIGKFLHTFSGELLHLIDSDLMSQEEIRNTESFYNNLEEAIHKKIIQNIDSVSHASRPINLFGSAYLSFLAPTGNDEIKLARHSALYKRLKKSYPPNFNMMSTIIKISNSEKSILLTSDAERKKFAVLTKILANEEFLLIQVPHHGSKKNLHEPFWQSITKRENCPSVYSVGEVKRDKLPNVEVVDFFHTNGFHNMSTNYVYGIKDFYPGHGNIIPSRNTPSGLNPFSKNITSKPANLPSRYSGDKQFTLQL